MGLLRIVIEKPEGKPLTELDVTLRPSEATAPQAAPTRQGKTDAEGVVRFWVEPGNYKVQFNALPEGIHPPKYGTTVRLEDYAEGIEQIIRLVR